VTIRIILDNHSAHISKETRAYLASRPNRFNYVHTPSTAPGLIWLKRSLAKWRNTFLRHIRVKSKVELKGANPIGDRRD